MQIRHSTYCTVAALALLFGQAAAAQNVSAHTFHIFIRGVQAGSEEVTLLEMADGWTLRGSGKLGAPLNLTTEYWEARYDRNWHPIELTVNQADATNHWSVHTVVTGTSAAIDVDQNGQNQRRNQTVAADSVLLPNLVFGSYEALAARLSTTPAGAPLPGFIVPQSAVSVGITRVTDEKIQMPGGSIDARHWTLTFGSPGAALSMEMWTEGTRLLRIDIPSQLVSVIRDDISSVGARLVMMARPNDEQVTIPANGFSLAATIAKPAASTGKLPAVVLISTSSSTDRDEVVAGIPIFAQLAGSLADAGWLVARYDKRGSGQSGGRPESATYEDFAADTRAVINYLARRKDVDAKRVAIIGFGEGGWIALTTAAREDRVAAVALLNTPSAKGTDLVLEQQRRLFDSSGTSAEAQEKAVAQQKLILDAVVTGKGWDTLAPDIRRRVDNPLYRSFLTFDPSQAIARTRQPLLVVQGDLDKEVPPHHGEQLAQLGRARVKAKPTEFMRVPGVNHLLVPAETGLVSEYGILTARAVSPAVGQDIASWLTKTLTPAETPR